jgi:hypothetical protein
MCEMVHMLSSVKFVNVILPLRFECEPTNDKLAHRL